MPFIIGPSLLASLLDQAIIVGLQFYYARYQRRKQERAAKRHLQAVDVEYDGTLEPRRVLYGDFRCAGLNILPAITEGASGERLHKAMVISEGNLSGFTSVSFNNDQVPVSSIPAGGMINVGKYSGYARVLFFDGTVSWEVLSNYIGVWTTDQDGFGLAGVYCGFYANNTIYDQGPPQVVVSGHGKLIYDPRLDTSPGANPTSGTYKAFSKTPPLQLADFLTWTSGCGELPANLVWTDVVDASNACEGSVTIPVGTQPRFTSSAEAYAPQTLAERNDTIRMFARAMLGICWFSCGKWRMRANTYVAPGPNDTITDADFLDGDIVWQTATSLANSGTFNAVRGSFVDEANNVQPMPFPEVTSSTFEAEDGERRYKDVEYKTCRTHWEAQRNAILELRQARTRQVITGTFRLRVWKFILWKEVTVTLSKFGWSGQTARITARKLKQNFTVDLEIESIASTDYTDPTTPEYNVPSAVGSPASASFKPGAPQNVRATSVPNGIILEWDPPANAPGVLLYQVFEYTSSTPFSSATQLGPDTAQNSIVLPKNDTTTRFYWVRAKLPDTGAVGTQAPPSNGVPGVATSASAGLSAVVVPGSANVLGYTSTLSTGTVTVTAIGGTAPYTYAATFISGGSGITINNGTTTSPSFTASGLSQGDVKTGTVRIRVTDNVSATFDVFVTVSITRDFDVTLSNVTLAASSGGPSPAIVIWTISADDHTVHHSPQPPGSPDYAWIAAGGNPANYDVRFTLNSGTLSSPSLTTGVPSSWVRMNSGVVQQLFQQRNAGGGAGTTTANVTVEARLTGSGGAIASCTVVLNATTTV